jgi:O-acetyl-ADP-ribose deacetylase (regulator of RNase III)
MIHIVEGNILNAPEDIIGHQVNCMGVMGVGLAYQIKKKYPVVFDEYIKLHDSIILKYGKHEGRGKLLGSAQFIDVGDKTIVNLFGQLTFGRSGIHTNYKALELALRSLYYSVTNDNCTLKGKTVALPYGIGCGWAGGDWNIVYRIIEGVFSDYDVTLYKLK